MPAPHRSVRLFVLLAVVTALLFLGSRHGVEASSELAPSGHSSLLLALPYHSGHAGAGRLTADLLDPDDHVLARTERRMQAAAGEGVWQQKMVPAQPVPFAEAVWDRVRFRFVYDDAEVPAIEGIEQVAAVLRRPVLRILGQSSYMTGSQAAVRVIVADGSREEGPEAGTVRIELLSGEGEVGRAGARLLYSGRLNERGTVEAQFRLPAGVAGAYRLRYVAETAMGTAEYTQAVTLEEKAAVLLTTEKPIYQPGQMIHVRALALDRADQHAQAGRPLRFELEDARGNKVFRKATSTDKFGVASAEFALADEVNLGAWHLRALLGDAAQPAQTAEIALNVERYVLPKFKVAVEFTQVNGKPKRDFRPGDHVTGTVRANYFFGKPVDHAEITVKAAGMDVTVFQAASAGGRTEADGSFHFDLKLPGFFAGRPLNQGSARALIEATVKDSAAHTETRGEPVTISETSLLITAIPEGGSVVPGLENHVYLMCAYPDGTPARASLVVHRAGGTQTVETDAAGLAMLSLRGDAATANLQVEADDHRGQRASMAVPVATREGTEQVLLRAGRAVLKVGDRLELKVLSTRRTGTAYVDLVHNGQTILTRDVELANGEATLSVAATPEMTGTLDVDAYLIGTDAQPVADHRLVFIQPASELKIDASTDATTYRPGSDARIHFHVSDSRGHGVSAALGVQIVDEAVFALAEKQPGFAKVFFYLEQEVMKPRYEIHSLNMADAVSHHEGDGDHDLAAQALFAATEMVLPERFETEVGRDLPEASHAEFQRRYEQAFRRQVGALAANLNEDGSHSAAMDLVKQYEHGKIPRDAWGTPIRLEVTSLAGRNRRYYLARSAGPDHVFDSGDDLTAYIEQRTGDAVAHALPAHGQGLVIEHDRGPFNGLAAVEGNVTDASGAVIPNAKIALRDHAGHTRRTLADHNGLFDLAGLAPGEYRMEIDAQGFVSMVYGLTLKARDLASVTATLQAGAVSETVTVTEASPMIALASPPLPMAMAAGMVGMAAGRGRALDQDAARIETVNGRLAPLPLEARSFAVLRKAAAPAASPATHVRSYFPEALYINPEITTDGHGDASITIPVADSITTWRMAMLASTQAGALGTGTGLLKVFQDFFVDLDLPVTLTQGDRITLPAAIYNYAGHRGEVSLKLQPEAWYSLRDDVAEKSVRVDPGHVGAASYTITADRIGKFKLTLTAHMEGQGEKRDDIVVRDIEVVPNGREANVVFNGRLESSARHDLRFPGTAIPDATTLFVRLYPGPLSQVMEGMDGILRMPGGCFEQTSSSTYPNVLALDYMKRTKKLTPEIHAKAEGYIANGYQRLLTFEVRGGGFSWFGSAPANQILTAYGLMEFNDMAKVSDVDPRLIERTRDWLISQQQPDGSWPVQVAQINEGATDRYNKDAVRITAYIAWSLANTGYRGPAVEKAKGFLQAHAGGVRDAYTLAVIANFAADYASDREYTNRSMQALLAEKKEQGDEVSWTSEETGVYATGASAAIETTGLATQALLKWGQASATVHKSLNFIAARKQAGGNWGTTSATITSLRALLLATQNGSSDVRGQAEIVLNGKVVETVKLTPDNNDLLHQFVVKNIDPRQQNSVDVRFAGSGTLAYQVAARYFMPWEEKPQGEPLSIDVAYDRTTLAENDIATATAAIRNITHKTANMVMVDLGIPPGFELMTEDLQSMVEKTANPSAGRLEKFSLTATQAILYFNALAPGSTVHVVYRLRAKYPMHAHTFASRVYEYYDPDVNAVARPIGLEVRGR